MKGFCAPNDKRPFNPVELMVVKLGAFDTAKLMEYHDMDNVAQLNSVGVEHFLTRLPALENTPKLKLDAHVEACWDTITRLHPKACNIFQWDNEPNRLVEQGGWRRLSGVWRSHMQYVMRSIKARAQKDKRVLYFVSPPLSYAPALWDELNDWKHAVATSPDHTKSTPPLTYYCDYAGANSYWEYPHHMLDGSYGMSWQDVHNWAGLPTIVVEYGYSGYLVAQNSTKLTIEDVRNSMAVDYPAYIIENQRRGAAASYLFQVGGTPDWQGLALPMKAAQTLGRVDLRRLPSP